MSATMPDKIYTPIFIYMHIIYGPCSVACSIHACSCTSTCTAVHVWLKAVLARVINMNYKPTLTLGSIDNMPCGDTTTLSGQGPIKSMLLASTDNT